MPRRTSGKNKKTKTEQMIEAMSAECDVVNVIYPNLEGWREGGRTIFLAPAKVMWAAQNLIDKVHDHRFLKKARILVRVATGKKADADGMIEAGRAQKASAMIKLLVTRVDEEPPDFVITINGDLYESADMADPDGTAGMEWLLPVLDHELAHCRPVIAGQFVSDKKYGKFLRDLGGDYIDTLDDCCDDSGRPLVRYLKRRGPLKPGQDGYHDQPQAWRVRKHEITEFLAVMGRWGARCAAVALIVDVMEKAGTDAGQMELFGPPEQPDKEAAA